MVVRRPLHVRGLGPTVTNCMKSLPAPSRSLSRPDSPSARRVPNPLPGWGLRPAGADRLLFERTVPADRHLVKRCSAGL